MEDKILAIELEDGSVKEFEIIFTFHSDETNKDYVLYVDPEDTEGNVYAQCYEETEDGSGELFDVETDAEWEMIEEVFGAFEGN